MDTLNKVDREAAASLHFKLEFYTYDKQFVIHNEEMYASEVVTVTIYPQLIIRLIYDMLSIYERKYCYFLVL